LPNLGARDILGESMAELRLEIIVDNPLIFRPALFLFLGVSLHEVVRQFVERFSLPIGFLLSSGIYARLHIVERIARFVTRVCKRGRWIRSKREAADFVRVTVNNAPTSFA